MSFFEGPFRVEDFEQSGWQEIIARCERRVCWYYVEPLLTRGKEAEASGEITKKDVFLLLAFLAALRPNPDARHQPYTYPPQIGGIPDPTLNDISDSVLDVLKEVAPRVIDDAMRARVADILWIRKRDHQMAELAVRSSLVADRLLGDPHDALFRVTNIQRAVNIAASLGKDGPVFAEVVSCAEHLIESVEHPSRLSLELMRLLLSSGRGDARKLGEMSRDTASQAESQYNWEWARTYWEVAAECFRRIGDAQRNRDCLISEAETYVSEAQHLVRGNSPSYMAASTCLTKAIEAYRRIGGMRARVTELHSLLLQHQKETLKEMSTVSSPMDLAKWQSGARSHVHAETLQEALFALASIMDTACKAGDVRAQVMEEAQNTPFPFLLSAEILDGAGRVVARAPSPLSDDPDVRERAIEAKMHRQSCFHRQAHVAAFIEPARQQIVLEHDCQIRDLLPIVANNPFVPMGREFIFARGLHAGLTGDYLIAAHLLIPQIEHTIRALLSERGVITSKIDQHGIQEERSLNELLYLPETREILGDDLVFDLQGLLTERFGSNLRNRMAHGLMDHDQFFSSEVAYLWWLVLRFCCWPFLLQRGVTESEPPEKTETDTSSGRADN